MNESEKPKKRWGWMEWLCVLIILGLTPLVILAARESVSDLVHRNTLAVKGKEILHAFKVFANDNSSTFPDVLLQRTTANQVFRDLIRYELVASEHTFSGEFSPCSADGSVGSAPDYGMAVRPGENHWAVLGGLHTNKPSTHPAIYENALDSSWPPQWQPGSANQPTRGRVWKGDKVLVGLVDGSISVVQTRPAGDSLMLPEAMLRDGTGTLWNDIKVLDIEEAR